MTNFAEVVACRGRFCGVEVSADPVREPVPDRLPERLGYNPGSRAGRLVAMDVAELLEAWTDFCTPTR